MSQVKLPPRPAHPVSPHPIAIVASLYNPEWVDGLVDAATSELHAILPGTPVDCFRVPGSFEIPVTVETLCRQNRFGAIVAFGVILQGATAHASLVASSVTSALQSISVEHATPIIHAVLSVASESDARERCLGTELNRGTEAARAAASMTTLFASLNPDRR